MKELRQIMITFDRDVEIAITFAHEEGLASPGTKRRTTTATRMARAGLEQALKGLDRGLPVWGGFGTNERVSTDRLVVDRRGENAA